MDLVCLVRNFATTKDAHLSTLCELLWGKKMQFDNGLGNMFALGIISSMFGGGWGSQSTGTDYLKKTLEEKDFEIETPNKAE